MHQKIGGQLSVVEQRIAAREAFLRLYRRAYVRSIGAELGIWDLSIVALREAAKSSLPTSFVRLATASLQV